MSDEVVGYGHREAAELLDVHPKTLDHHIRRGHLKPDARTSSGDRVYGEETIQRFREQYLREEGLSLLDVVAQYHVTYPVAWRAFSIKRSIRPDGKRGHTKMYNASVVQMVAAEEAWRKR